MTPLLKKMFLPAGLIGAAALIWSFGWPNSGPVLESTPQVIQNTSLGGQKEFKFEFDDNTLPDAHDSSNATHTAIIVPEANDFDNWRVFATFDDGTFWMGSKQKFESTGFPFSQSGNHTVSVEMAPTYDDGNTNPGKYTLTFPVAGSEAVSTATAQRIQALPPNTFVRLQSSLNPRPGNVLTYIITYQNPSDSRCDNISGNLKLYFDKNVITYDNTEEFEPAAATVADVTVSGAVYKQVTIPFQNLARGTQRNAFVRCTTATTLSTGVAVTTATPFFTPWVDFEPAAGCDVGAQSSSLSTQYITNSHDPNDKVAVEQEVCMDKDSVTFTVSFQNEGPGPTQKVVVTDELHRLLQNVKPRLVAWSTPAPPVIGDPGTDRTVTFTFDPLQLKGLHEQGLGTRFTEADTRASFSFRCALNAALAADYPCNAILNKARIRFDCNPWMETDLAVVKMRCVFCDTCLTQADTTIMIMDTIPTTGIPMFSPVLAPLVAGWGYLDGWNVGADRHIWYPGADLNQSTDFNPLFNDPKHYRYTLVQSIGSGAISCDRRWLHVNFKNPCDLGIHIDATGLQFNACAGTVSGTLTASATGNHSSNLQWHKCAITGPTFTYTLTNTDQLEYYFGLTDETTGCSKELVYVIKIPPCNPGGGGWGGFSWPVLSAIIAAILALSWWLRNKFFKKGKLAGETFP